METLIDSCVWIDFFHPKSSKSLRQLTYSYVNRAEAVICEPVFAEVFHGMPDRKADRVAEHLETMPMLPTPNSLWRDVIQFIRTCTAKGNPIGTLDALIAVIALKNNATIVTFDQDFLILQKHCGVAVELLKRPA